MLLINNIKNIHMLITMLTFLIAIKLLTIIKKKY